MIQMKLQSLLPILSYLRSLVVCLIFPPSVSSLLCNGFIYHLLWITVLTLWIKDLFTYLILNLFNLLFRATNLYAACAVNVNYWCFKAHRVICKCRLFIILQNANYALLPKRHTEFQHCTKLKWLNYSPYHCRRSSQEMLLCCQMHLFTVWFCYLCKEECK